MGSIATRLDKAEKALQGTTNPDIEAWLSQLSDHDLDRLLYALQSIEDARAAGREEPEDAVQIIVELQSVSFAPGEMIDAEAE